MRQLPLHAGAQNLDDDCALLEAGGETLVITQDSLAEGTHWLEGSDPFDIAWKLVAVNLSDLAAKGAQPVGLLLSYTLGKEDARFLEGLGAILSEYDVPLLGGDTIATNAPPTHTMTAIGKASHLPVPSRSGAKAGDRVFVTGEIGCAMLGLEQLGSRSRFDLAYRRPEPLLAEGRALAPHVTAMMDISDGLLLDCWRMANASGTQFQLESDGIPVADRSRFDACIRWGDDYQLLFTSSADSQLPIDARRIGTVASAPTAGLRLDGKPLGDGDELGFEHRIA